LQSPFARTVDLPSRGGQNVGAGFLPILLYTKPPDFASPFLRIRAISVNFFRAKPKNPAFPGIKGKRRAFAEQETARNFLSEFAGSSE